MIIRIAIAFVLCFSHAIARENDSGFEVTDESITVLKYNINQIDVFFNKITEERVKKIKRFETTGSCVFEEILTSRLPVYKNVTDVQFLNISKYKVSIGEVLKFFPSVENVDLMDVIRISNLPTLKYCKFFFADGVLQDKAIESLAESLNLVDAEFYIGDQNSLQVIQKLNKLDKLNRLVIHVQGKKSKERVDKLKTFYQEKIKNGICKIEG